MDPKSLALEEVGRVHGVTGTPQVVRERVESVRLALGVVEQQYLCHRSSFVAGGTIDP